MEKKERAVAFSIGDKGYIGTGDNGISHFKNFLEYDPSIDEWVKKADFGGVARREAIGFSIGGRGYIGTGYTGTEQKSDFWEYDPVTDTWEEKASKYQLKRMMAVGFSIGNKGYIGTGFDCAFKNDFWEYDPSIDKWSQRPNFPGISRYGAVGFSIGDKGYIGLGKAYGFILVNDFWEYDSSTDKWTQIADFMGPARYNAVGFSIGSKGYVGTGLVGNNIWWTKDIWQYDPYPLSIEDEHAVEVLGITIHPNPTTGKFQIQNLNPDSYRNQVKTVELFDAFGRKVQPCLSGRHAYSTKYQGSSISVDISNVPAGTYFWRLSTEHSILGAGKLVVID